jgi:hypothetical protein
MTPEISPAALPEIVDIHVGRLKYCLFLLCHVGLGYRVNKGEITIAVETIRITIECSHSLSGDS